jgi:hypothetical protein
LKSCKLLIGFIDRHISQLDWNYDNALDYESRIRVVLEDKAIEKCLNQLNNQTHALNLVLTAFSWLVCRLASDCIGRHTDLISRTHSEQKELRERETSRQVFDQVKDDSSSLVVLRDSASFLSSCTKTTENSSKLSMRFMFDGELLQSRVYQGTVRSLLRRAIRGGREINAGSSVSITPHKLSKEEKDKAARSSQIDSLIDKDAKRLRREVKVWVLGAPRSGESTICKTIKSGYDGPDMYGARNIVRNALSDRLIIPVVIFKYK